MMLLAVVFGTMAIFAGQRYLDRQSSRFREVQLVPKAAPTQTIVVAALPLKFGVEVTRQHLWQLGGVLGAGALAGVAPSALAADPEIPPEGLAKGVKHIS